MQTILKSFLILTIIFGLNSCSIGMGEKLNPTENSESKTFQVSNFNGVHVAEGIELELHKSTKEYAEAESNYLEYLRLDNEDGILKVHFDFPNNSYANNNQTKVVLYAKDVNYFKASSSGSLWVKDSFDASSQNIKVSSSGEIEYNVKCENLNIEASSSGDYEGNIQTKNLTVKTSSSADVQIAGHAQNADLDVSASGEINGKNLNAAYVKAEASSSGTIYITVSKSLEADASSSGDIVYRADGEIQVQKDESSSGSVKPY